MSVGFGARALIVGVRRPRLSFIADCAPVDVAFPTHFRQHIVLDVESQHRSHNNQRHQYAKCSQRQIAHDEQAAISARLCADCDGDWTWNWWTSPDIRHTLYVGQVKFNVWHTHTRTHVDNAENVDNVEPNTSSTCGYM